jgi:predicted Zn-dependent protease
MISKGVYFFHHSMTFLVRLLCAFPMKAREGTQMASFARRLVFTLVIVSCSFLELGCQSSGSRFAPFSKLANRSADNPAARGKRSPFESEKNKASLANSARQPANPAAATPTATRSLRDQVEPLGAKLAQHSPRKQMKLEFGYLENPTPRGHHTSSGHVFVTTGMLSQLSNADELAAVLALEVAEMLAELELNDSQPEPSVVQVNAEFDHSGDHAVAGKLAADTRRPNPSEVDRIARELLNKAGFSHVDLSTIRSKLATIHGPAKSREQS